jgi:hypothetical protein
VTKYLSPSPSPTRALSLYLSSSLALALSRPISPYLALSRPISPSPALSRPLCVSRVRVPGVGNIMPDVEQPSARARAPSVRGRTRPRSAWRQPKALSAVRAWRKLPRMAREPRFTSVIGLSPSLPRLPSHQGSAAARATPEKNCCWTRDKLTRSPEGGTRRSGGPLPMLPTIQRKYICCFARVGAFDSSDCC